MKHLRIPHQLDRRYEFIKLTMFGTAIKNLIYRLNMRNHSPDPLVIAFGDGEPVFTKSDIYQIRIRRDGYLRMIHINKDKDSLRIDDGRFLSFVTMNMLNRVDKFELLDDEKFFKSKRDPYTPRFKRYSVTFNGPVLALIRHHLFKHTDCSIALFRSFTYTVNTDRFNCQTLNLEDIFEDSKDTMFGSASWWKARRDTRKKIRSLVDLSRIQ